MPPILLPRSDPDEARDHVVVPLARAPVPDGQRQAETSGITDRTLDRRWIVISVAAHLAVIGALVFGLLEAPQPPPPPVLQITLIPQAPGSAGISGGASASTASATADASATAGPIKPEIPAPAAEPVSPPALAKPVMQPAAPPRPEIPPPPSPRATPAVPPQLTMQIPPPKPQHIPQRHQAPRQRETPPRETVTSPVSVPPAAPPAASTQTKTALASPAVGPGQGQGARGAGQGAIGNSAGPGDDYLEKLYRHLLRYKKYPPEAISAKQQGKVEISFAIARDGSISEARIEKSSGSTMLDQATLALVQRASPAPPLPDSFKGDTARVKFPIDYKLSLIDEMF